MNNHRVNSQIMDPHLLLCRIKEFITNNNDNDATISVEVSTNTDVGGGVGRGGKVVSEVRGGEEWLNGVG